MAIFWTAFLGAVTLPALALAYEVRRANRPADLCVSPFWYFTLLWLVAFPARAAFLGTGETAQSGHAFGMIELAKAMMIATMLWLAVWMGHTLAKGRTFFKPVDQPLSWMWATIFLSALSLTGIAVMISGIGKIAATSGGHGYFQARVGQGWFFLLPELAPMILPAFAALWLSERPTGWAAICLGGGLALALIETVMTIPYLVTRRHIALIFLLLMLVLALSRPDRRALGLLAIIGTLIGSAVLDVARAVALWAVAGRPFDLEEVLNFSKAAFLSNLSNSFEGADHVARLLQTASPSQLLAGIDYGVSWLFNAGLSLVPRNFWPAKPLATGNLAQQQFLYPDHFTDGISRVSQPPSFVVDYLFGFGLPGAIILAFLTGWLLRHLGNYMLEADTPLALRAVALFCFANMFNLIRGGTGFLIGLVMFLGLLLVLTGPRHCLSALRIMLPGKGISR